MERAYISIDPNNLETLRRHYKAATSAAAITAALDELGLSIAPLTWKKNAHREAVRLIPKEMHGEIVAYHASLAGQHQPAAKTAKWVQTEVKRRYGRDIRLPSDANIYKILRLYKQTHAD